MTAVGFAPGTALASSHREAPLVAADPLADNTDVYAFVSPDDSNSVTLIANWIPFEEPNGGPNFYPFGTGAKTDTTANQGYTYDIKIDSNGDAKPDITYRWTFSSQDTRGTNTFLYNNGPVTSLTDDNLLFRQTYKLDAIAADGTVTTLLKNAPVAPSNVGPASMPNYDKDLFQAAVTDVPGGGQSYAGQADDPFFLDLRVFDLLYGAGAKADGSGLNEVGQDTLAGYNVNTVSLKLPKDTLALKGDATANPVIGVWSTTNRESVNLGTGAVDGTPVQVSRLGQPLVNEVVIPAALKDTFNAIDPTQDATVGKVPSATFGPVVDRVTNPEVPQLIKSIYGAPAPTGDPGTGQTTNRTDIAEIFLTGVTKNSSLDAFYAALGSGSGKAPIQADLNSQTMNTNGLQFGAGFQPSEMLRLNMSINKPTKLDPKAEMTSSLGVVGNDLQGFPNGRRLTDDVVDIELVTLGGFFLPGNNKDTEDPQNSQAALLAKVGGDQVGVNDKAFGTSFPYIASPHNSSVNKAEGGTVTVAGPTTTVTATVTATPSPTANGGSGKAQGSVPPANGVRTPKGGVDTGAGGSTPTSAVLPLVTGTAAVLLLAAGGASIVSNRRKRAAAEDTTAE
ncbi:DUF4331 domain-containing protein [Rhodococcus antarcticus]|uniref:DUF4331 domain-containing protein n=1 Tax=Rhodococcus antarcticus TaxID=2987751 RepID=A0ABY6NVU5_9NOCA|nr:DUF4331 domain-containing protein [Rhodococcus antarcticus]UZJ23515.1 DUF4331 domain-containing protein [Rhodococcus antarcticus]